MKGKKSGITRKEYQRLLNGRFHGAKRIVESSKKKALQGRGALSREERDTIREFQAINEENILSSWLREDGKSKTKEDKEVREDGCERRKRGREKEEYETVVQRKCVNPVSIEAFHIFSQGEISECDSCGVNSDCESGKWSMCL